LRHRLRSELEIPEDSKVFLFSASYYDPNIEAFRFIKDFVDKSSLLLRRFRMLFLVVGTVSPKPIKSEFLIATSEVESTDPFFSAADFAINPVVRGAGTSIKASEFIASKLPLFSTPFGVRGFNLMHEKEVFLFERETLGKTLEKTFNDDVKVDFQLMAERAFHRNRECIDMAVSIGPLSRWLDQNPLPKNQV
jgi:hypothetical protein